ncbi:hypothetical protein KVR01_009822 [Diaporthe batatas]|uniref:uncharacterized protein n=1 Tax=Diaporthe batatas TaxID=748121 RepID=UPI001D055478|nr:uncharacterized protein KVR01_009822 [Diaporthe batatas]KAG8160286.1 hypothetical protein KVR01_009822 [Diaporthe batatas]
MANYGRQGSHLAQFMREQLNTVSTSEPEEDFTSLDNLDLFANTQFFDFDSQTQTDFKPAADSPPSSKAEPTSATSTIPGEFGGMDFNMNNGEFNFGDFNNAYASPTLHNFPDSLGSLQPIQPNPQAVYPAYASHAGSQPKTGDKRRAAEPQTPNRAMNMEEVSRVAAEEDKRRRNTAASARFRVKKKQREQALEKSAKEMSEKVAALEQKITQLETENQWLKKLVIEKNEGSSSSKASSQATSDSKKEEKEEKAEAEIIAKTDGAPEAKKAKTGTSS